LDIDDTLTTHGKLTAPAFEALWKLKSAGYKVVPVTGRPAGWCDLIARFWPVDAVIGENGAFSFFMKDGVRRRSDTPGAAPGHRQLLRGLEATVLKRFPHARWASDQSYREYDLAIDFCEDVPRWPQADLDELVALCEKVGAHAKVSSIHLNAWFGSYDKRKGFEHWLGQGAPGVEGAVPAADEWLFIGDSPNDEPLFESFDLSVGVANLQPFLARLKSPPRWLTSSQSGSGFGEMVAGLLKGSAKK
jgi:HAD superfamily hydrolase (TIGR01484 family)